MSNFTISENSPKESQRRRRPSLKSTKSSEKRRSRGHSVHFVSPVTENSENVSLPHTPYNRDSLGKFIELYPGLIKFFFSIQRTHYNEFCTWKSPTFPTFLH